MAYGRRHSRWLMVASLGWAAWAAGLRGWAADSEAAPPRVFPEERAAIEFRFSRDRLTEADRRLLQELASFVDEEGMPIFKEQERHGNIAWACWLLEAESLQQGQPVADATVAGGALGRALNWRILRHRNDANSRAYTAWNRERPASMFGVDRTLRAVGGDPVHVQPGVSVQLTALYEPPFSMQRMAALARFGQRDTSTWQGQASQGAEAFFISEPSASFVSLVSALNGVAAPVGTSMDGFGRLDFAAVPSSTFGTIPYWVVEEWALPWYAARQLARQAVRAGSGSPAESGALVAALLEDESRWSAERYRADAGDADRIADSLRNAATAGMASPIALMFTPEYAYAGAVDSTAAMNALRTLDVDAGTRTRSRPGSPVFAAAMPVAFGAWPYWMNEEWARTRYVVSHLARGSSQAATAWRAEPKSSVTALAAPDFRSRSERPGEALHGVYAAKPWERPGTFLGANALAGGMNGWAAWRTLLRDENGPALRHADAEALVFARNEILRTLSPSRVSSDGRLNQGLEFAWKLHHRTHESFAQFRRAAERADGSWTSDARGLAALTAWAMKQKSWDDALSLAEAWLEHDDGTVEAWYSVTQSAWEARHLDLVDEYGTGLLDAFPASPRRANAYWLLGLAAGAREKVDAQKQWWNRLMAEYPKTYEANEAKKRLTAPPPKPAPPLPPPVHEDIDVF